MTRALAGFLCLYVALAAASASGFGEEFIVVERTDRTGVKTYEVMTSRALYALEKSLRKEASYSSRALMMAQRAWKEDVTNSGNFLRSVAKPIGVRELGRYRSEEDAAEAVDKYAAREIERQDKRDRDLKERFRETYYVRASWAGGPRRKRTRINKERYKEALQARAERQENIERSAALYELMIETCREQSEKRIAVAPPDLGIPSGTP